MRKMLSGLLLFALLYAPTIARAQTLEVSPARVLFDESAVIRASGLHPDERVSIEATLVDGAGQSWASQAEFKADAQGIVEVSKQAPVAGSYKEVSAMGLIWSMRPTTKNVTTYRPPQNFAPQTIQFRLLKNDAQVANAQLEQVRIADGVQRTRLTSELHGTLFVPN